MSTIRLSQATEDSLVGRHTTAAEGITGLADSMPTQIDGGLGSPELLTILSSVATTADQIAQINETLSALVAAAHDNVQVTDSGLAVTFERVADTIPDEK